MLITSRYRFTLPADGRDLAQKLLAIPLPPMDEDTGRKQAQQKVRSQSDTVALDGERTQRCIDIAKGNAGLQDQLFSLSLQDAAACDRALDAMDAYLNQGKTPDGATPDVEAVRAFLQNLALQEVINLLTPDEHTRLQLSTLFQQPVPTAVLDRLAQDQGINTPQEEDRLTALGLWESFPDLVQRKQSAIAINALVQPLIEPLSGVHLCSCAETAVAALSDCWAGDRPELADVELTRLALVAKAAAVLADAAEPALRWLDEAFRYRDAAAWGRQAIAILDDNGITPSIGLFQITGHCCVQVGETAPARTLYERAVSALPEASPKADVIEHGGILLSHGRLLQQEGQLASALACFERAKALFASADITRDRAIALGEIARILVSKGDVDQAMRLHQEKLAVCESLGDLRSRAITLGDIADILVSKGDVDAALALQTERLETNETLGDADGKASALWAIAQIELGKKAHEKAFEHMAQAYSIFQTIGQLQGIVAVGITYGQFLCARGDTETGLAVLQRSQEGLQKLGQHEMAAQVQSVMDQITAS